MQPRVVGHRPEDGGLAYEDGKAALARTGVVSQFESGSP